MTNEQQAQLESEARAEAREAARNPDEDRRQGSARLSRLHGHFKSEGGSFHIWWSSHPVVVALSEERTNLDGGPFNSAREKGLWPFRTGRLSEAYAGGWETVDRIMNDDVWMVWTDAYRHERKIMEQESEQDDGRKLETYDDLLAALEPLTDAASKQLPQGPDHDGLANCDLLAQARAAIAKAKGGDQ